MRKVLILTFLISCAQLSGQNTNKLTIVFTNLKVSEGNVAFQVLDDKGEVMSSKEIPAEAGETIVSLELPAGSYTVKAFHDKNSNHKLDTNTFGIPSEPYGFSNDARGMFGPPDIKDQIFILDQDQQISITLK